MKTAYGFALRLLTAITLVTVLAAAVPSHVAYAGDCDGTPGNDLPQLICAVDPTVPDANIGLGLGKDNLVVSSGVTADLASGDSLEDGTWNTGDGGNDSLIIHGDVYDVQGDTTVGNGGDDFILITGDSYAVRGDYVDGNGGNDKIVVSGTGNVSGVLTGDDASGDGGDDEIVVEAGGYAAEVLGDFAQTGGTDSITINGTAGNVFGDGVLGNGGSDKIIINGTVTGTVTGDAAENGADDYILISGTVSGDVVGDGINSVAGDGGNDSIVIKGTVAGNVLGDDAPGAGGDDTVTLGFDASVGGTIDGGGGHDILKFAMLWQHQLKGYDPNAGSITVDGHTYSWANFEELIGLLQTIAEEDSRDVLYQRSQIVVVRESAGVYVFSPIGRVALIPSSLLKNLEVGGSQTYTGPNSQGWYVTVVNLGVDPIHPKLTLYKVTIYDASGNLHGDFTFSD